MALINFTAIQDGTAPQASQVNNPLNTIYNEFNGNISAPNLANNAVTTPKIADGAVTNEKLDNSNWKIVGRTLLGSSATSISVDSLPACKFLKIFYYGIGSGLIPQLRFNADASNNYAFNRSNGGGADSSSTSQNHILIGRGSAGLDSIAIAEIVNFQTRPKLVNAHTVNEENSGVGTASSGTEIRGKWQNTANLIDRIAISTSGNMSAGSELIVYGHN
jgi:hypothetical protein